MIIFLSPGITKGFFIFAVLVCVLKREMAVVSESAATGTAWTVVRGTA